MNICITGISGYLGSVLSHKLSREGFRVVGLGSSSVRPTNIPESVAYYTIDIRNTEALAEMFKNEKITTVYHFAAIKYVGKCEEDPETCFAINTHGTEAVLEAMKIAAVPHLVYASTYAVYDWSGDNVILQENSKLNPSTVYGESKKQSEELIHEAFRNGSIRCFQILRYGNIIGSTPDIKPTAVQSFADRVLYAARHNTSVTIFGLDYNTPDGSAARDFVDVRDVIEANSAALHSTFSGIYNISTGATTTLLKLVEIVESVTNKKISIEIAMPNKKEPSTIVIDNKKAITDLSWSPQYSLEEAIRNLDSSTDY